MAINFKPKILRNARPRSYSYSVQRYSYSYSNSKASPKPQPTFTHDKIDVYPLSIDYVPFSYQITKSPGGTNRQARDQSLRCGYWMRLTMNPMDAVKCDLKGIVSMLTRLIQRTTEGSEDRIEYEYEYRDAEYEYDHGNQL